MFNGSTARTNKNTRLSENYDLPPQETKDALNHYQNDIELLTQFSFNHCSDAVLCLHPDGVILHVNNQACRMLGYNRNELIQMNICDLDPNFQAASWADHWRVLKASQTLRLESVHRTKNGHLLPVEIHANYLCIGDREYDCAFARDITNNQTLQHQLRKYEQRINLSQRMESLGTLAGGIAHDFNNILSSILGFAELSLDLTEPDDRLHGNIQEIFLAGMRARDLVKQILTFSRQTQQERQPLQTKLIVKEVLRLMRASLPSTIKIRTNIKSNGLILADPSQLHQIVMNLCTNAGHAMQSNGGTLTVELFEVQLEADFSTTHPEILPGTYVQLIIGDTGKGIPDDILPYIFEPFFTTKTQGEGTGMGLSLVKKIVDEYSGCITVESRKDKGSTFTVYLPLLKKAVTPHTEPIKSLPTGDEHILLVDDEPSISKMTAQMLQRLGYRVTHFVDSLEALTQFRKIPSQFDLVITDLTMPNLPGNKLAAQMIAMHPRTPIILTTGYGSEMSDAKTKDLGFKALLIKPIDKKQLAETVRQVLNSVEKNEP